MGLRGHSWNCSEVCALVVIDLLPPPVFGPINDCILAAWCFQSVLLVLHFLERRGELLQMGL